MPALIAEWNGLLPPYPLAVGQSLLILSPVQTHTVMRGDTVFSVCSRYGITQNDLFRKNPSLCGGYVPLSVGQTLVIEFAEKPDDEMFSYAYAYTFIEERILRQTLPYLSALAPFTYGFTSDGTLLSLPDSKLLSACSNYGTMPLMHISTLTESGGFSNELASELFASEEAQNNLISEIIAEMTEKGYGGLDIDFEFVFAYDAESYADFIAKARAALAPYGYTVYAALAPKTSASQPGLLYEGHLYDKIGAAADKVFLMTYEWGYTYGPPLAVAPKPQVRQVIEYALSEIPSSKIFMGIPNYGYDWTLPYVRGESKAQSLSNIEALRLAGEKNAEIMFSETAQTPYFNYFERNSRGGASEHVVWFDDARSMDSKLRLISEYGLYGGGVWNVMKYFPALWTVMNSLYNIRKL